MKEQLLTHCRHYTGTDNNKPKEGDDLICWTAEQAWISRTSEEHEDDVFDLDAYIHAGLKDFQKYDGFPVTLKAMLFSFFCKLNERVDAEGFKTFYLKNYA